QGKLEDKNQAQTYKDQEQISPWAKEAVRKMTEAGIFKGQDKGNFAPNKTLTRAEFAQVIYTMNN
ncbi:S-layer homology domain-containing protein, partial [Urinicoccus timonensis]|uniref:S-layer homology domain-containing protein n=1 Tax=Urinicoccus timonensis TaxID=2024205 RepID=UPI0011801557